MSITGQVQEPSLRDQLLADYEAHEDRIEQAAGTELWRLADWLAEYVPPRHPGPRGASELDIVISLEDLAERRGRSLRWLQNLRRLALATEVDRMPRITPSVYAEALRAHSWDLMAANQAILTRGHRLRDQREGKVESLDAIRDSLDRRPPQDRAELARELAADPTVAELLGDETPPDFGANWADKLVCRISEQADKLTSLVRREGLVFTPGADLVGILHLLESAERQVADVRAAVQERLRDQQTGAVV